MYDTEGNPRNCVGTGEDGEHQKGVEGPNPRFTDNEDGTVTDNLTGLMWLRDANCMYISCQGLDVDGSVDGNVTWQHALDFISKINDGTYWQCSGAPLYSDWRLPNRLELESLLHLEYSFRAWPNTAGTGQGEGGDPFTNVGFFYWTSTTYADHPTLAWILITWDGYLDPSAKSNELRIWPVRGGQ